MSQAAASPKNSAKSMNIADKFGTVPSGGVKKMKKMNWQLLHLGAYLDWSAKYVPFLVKKSAELTKLPVAEMINVGDRDRRSSLHIAAQKDNYRFIRGLVQQDDLDVDVTDKKGFTAMHYAAEAGNTRVVSSLIFHKANPNIKSTDGERTPLHMALCEDHMQIAKSLFYHGSADITLKTRKDRSCLHLAAQYVDGCGIVEICLLSNKFDVNEKDKYGNTPLHYAVKCGALETVKLLIKHGASVEILNDANITPLHLAIYSGYFYIVDYLVMNQQCPKLLTSILVSILSSKDADAYEDVISYIRNRLEKYLKNTSK